MVSASTRWSVYAGVYAFFVGIAVLLPLGIVANTLLKIIGISSSFADILPPVSNAIIATLIWWTVVERREQYSYLRGGIVGLLTAVFTTLLWAGIVAITYSLGAVVAAGVVLLFVIAVAAPIGFIAVLPLMYARHQRSDVQLNGNNRTPS